MITQRQLDEVEHRAVQVKNFAGRIPAGTAVALAEDALQLLYEIADLRGRIVGAIHALDRNERSGFAVAAEERARISGRGER